MKTFLRKIVNILLTYKIVLYVFDTQKNRLIETVLLSTHNILDTQKNRLIETVLLSTNNICFG